MKNLLIINQLRKVEIKKMKKMLSILKIQRSQEENQEVQELREWRKETRRKNKEVGKEEETKADITENSEAVQ